MHPFKVREENFCALPERALWWPKKKILIIADLHLGRSEAHAEYGLPRLHQVENEDLKRLDRLVTSMMPEELFILGDFIHNGRALQSDVRTRFLEFRKNWSVRPTVILGNHDRAFLEVHAEEWGVKRVTRELCVGEFIFSHDKVISDKFNWLGHLHPAWKFSSGSDQAKVPCFWIQKDNGIIPAFSSWAAGGNIRSRPGDQLFLVVEDRKIIAIPG